MPRYFHCLGDPSTPPFDALRLLRDLNKVGELVEPRLG